MKTAVEWLEDNLIPEPWAEEHFKHNSECWDKAKEMDKEQKIDFARLCLNKAKDLDILTSFMNAEQYYNETFKSE
jgi:hypothetical protein